MILILFPYWLICNLLLIWIYQTETESTIVEARYLNSSMSECQQEWCVQIMFVLNNAEPCSLRYSTNSWFNATEFLITKRYLANQTYFLQKQSSGECTELDAVLQFDMVYFIATVTYILIAIITSQFVSSCLSRI
jgi:hypothetical protein